MKALVIEVIISSISVIMPQDGHLIAMMMMRLFPIRINIPNINYNDYYPILVITYICGHALVWVGLELRMGQVTWQAVPWLQ